MAIRAVIFDWGDTVMRDFPEMPGPMFTWPHVELVPGILPVLTHASSHYICVIATNAGCSDTEAMRRALQRLDVEQYFHHFFSSKDLGFEKPDPRFFHAIANSLGVDKNDCVMIGNSYEKDIHGAHVAGMRTVFFNENAAAGHYPSADTIIKHIDQLMQIL
jgi:putative hydrolase of the HAD superfamily